MIPKGDADIESNLSIKAQSHKEEVWYLHEASCLGAFVAETWQ